MPGDTKTLEIRLSRCDSLLADSRMCRSGFLTRGKGRTHTVHQGARQTDVSTVNVSADDASSFNQSIASLTSASDCVPFPKSGVIFPTVQLVRCDYLLTDSVSCHLNSITDSRKVSPSRPHRHRLRKRSPLAFEHGHRDDAARTGPRHQINGKGRDVLVSSYTTFQELVCDGQADGNMLLHDVNRSLPQYNTNRTMFQQRFNTTSPQHNTDILLPQPNRDKSITQYETNRLLSQHNRNTTSPQHSSDGISLERSKYMTSAQNNTNKIVWQYENGEPDNERDGVDTGTSKVLTNINEPRLQWMESDDTDFESIRKQAADQEQLFQRDMHEGKNRLFHKINTAHTELARVQSLLSEVDTFDQSSRLAAVSTQFWGMTVQASDSTGPAAMQSAGSLTLSAENKPCCVKTEPGSEEEQPAGFCWGQTGTSTTTGSCEAVSNAHAKAVASFDEELFYGQEMKDLDTVDKVKLCGKCICDSQSEDEEVQPQPCLLKGDSEKQRDETDHEKVVEKKTGQFQTGVSERTMIHNAHTLMMTDTEVGKEQYAHHCPEQMSVGPPRQSAGEPPKCREALLESRKGKTRETEFTDCALSMTSFLMSNTPQTLEIRLNRCGSLLAGSHICRSGFLTREQRRTHSVLQSEKKMDVSTVNGLVDDDGSSNQCIASLTSTSDQAPFPKSGVIYPTVKLVRCDYLLTDSVSCHLNSIAGSREFPPSKPHHHRIRKRSLDFELGHSNDAAITWPRLQMKRKGGDMLLSSSNILPGHDCDREADTDMLLHSMNRGLPPNCTDRSLPQHTTDWSWPQHNTDRSLPQHNIDRSLSQHNTDRSLSQHNTDWSWPLHNTDRSLPQHNADRSLSQHNTDKTSQCSTGVTSAQCKIESQYENGVADNGEDDGDGQGSSSPTAENMPCCVKTDPGSEAVSSAHTNSVAESGQESCHGHELKDLAAENKFKLCGKCDCDSQAEVQEAGYQPHLLTEESFHGFDQFKDCGAENNFKLCGKCDCDPQTEEEEGRSLPCLLKKDPEKGRNETYEKVADENNVPFETGVPERKMVTNMERLVRSDTGEGKEPWSSHSHGEMASGPLHQSAEDSSTFDVPIQQLQESVGKNTEATDRSLPQDSTDRLLSKDRTDMSLLQHSTDTSLLQHSSDTSLLQHSTDRLLPQNSSDMSLLQYSTDTSLLQHSSETSLLQHSSDTSLLQHSTYRSLLQHSTDTSLLQRSSDRSLSQHNTDRSFAQRNTDRSFVEHNTDRSLPRHSSDKSLSQHNTDRPLSQHNTDRSLPQHNTDRSLSQHNTDRSFTQHNIDRSIAQHNTDMSLPQHHTDMSFAQRNTGRSVPQNNTDRSLPQHSSDRSLSQHNTDRSFAQDNTGRSSPQYNTVRSSVQHNTDWTVQDKTDRTSAQNNTDRTAQHKTIRTSVQQITDRTAQHKTTRTSAQQITDRTAQDNTDTPAQHNTDRASVKHNTDRTAAQDNADTSAQHNTDRTVQHNTERTAQHNTERTAQHNTERTAQHNTDRTSLDNTDKTAQDNTDRTSAQDNTDRTSAQHNADRTLAQHNADRTSAHHNADRTSAQGNTDRTSAQGNADRTSAQHNADMTSQHNADMTSVQDNADRTSAQLNANKMVWQSENDVSGNVQDDGIIEDDDHQEMDTYSDQGVSSGEEWTPCSMDSGNSDFEPVGKRTMKQGSDQEQNNQGLMGEGKSPQTPGLQCVQEEQSPGTCDSAVCLPGQTPCSSTAAEASRIPVCIVNPPSDNIIIRALLSSGPSQLPPVLASSQDITSPHPPLSAQVTMTSSSDHLPEDLPADNSLPSKQICHRAMFVRGPHEYQGSCKEQVKSSGTAGRITAGHDVRMNQEKLLCNKQSHGNNNTTAERADVKQNKNQQENHDRLVRCDVCGARFKRQSERKRHMMWHSDARPFSCDQCNACYKTVYHVKRHIKSVHSSVIRCSTCVELSASKKIYSFHYNAQGMCQHCGVVYKSLCKIKEHMLHVELVEKWKPAFLYLCEVCGEKFNQLLTLRKHKKKHTKADYLKASEEICKSVSDGDPQAKYCGDSCKSFLCEVCGKIYATRRIFRVHKKTVHCKETKAQPFECNNCSKRFSSRALLKAHSKAHQLDRPHQCDVCGARFKSKSTLNGHVARHSTARPFSCGPCDASFKTNSALRRHERGVHALSKPFSCELCPATFKTKPSLTSHVVRHKRVANGSYKKKCLLCGRICANANSYRTHMRKHTGEKPFKCRDCDACFAQYTSRDTHWRTHHGVKPYKCDLCDARFARSDYLKKHSNTHQGAQAIKCKDCSGSFSDMKALKIHLRKHHTPQ